MNIDYGKIIELANTRKEALQQLETASAAFMTALQQALRSDGLFRAAEKFKWAYGALDPEGQKLLPEGAGGPANQLAEKLIRVRTELNQIANYYKVSPMEGLRQLQPEHPIPPSE